VARASRIPFTEAARTLLVEGVAKRASHDALVSTISVAAIATRVQPGRKKGRPRAYDSASSVSALPAGTNRRPSLKWTQEHAWVMLSSHGHEPAGAG
jgi:hypothetical protein